MKKPLIVVHDCRAYFFRTADTNNWGKYSILIMSQYSDYWVSSTEPFVIYEYGTDKQINPATLQGSTLEGQIMVEVVKQKNRTCHKMIALQVQPYEWTPNPKFDTNPFRSIC